MSKANWAPTKISEFALLSENSEVLSTDKIYRILGMSLEGRGLFLRDQKIGLEIGSKTLNRVIPGEFIYSRLFAWKGAFDYVKDEFNQCYVSDEYPTFIIDKDKADVKFLHYYFNQAKVWREVESYCIGVTKASRNRFKEQYFLNMNIPLPPIEEQRKIVSKIESVKQNLEKIRLLREEQAKDIKNLLFSKYTEVIEGVDWYPMQIVAPIHRRQVKIELEETYQELGARSFFKGLFEKERFKGSDLTWEKPYWMKEGDLVFSNIKGWEGAVALVPEKYDGWVASHRYITCLPNLDLIKAEFLLYFFSTPTGLEILQNASPGSADRNRTLNTRTLMQAKVPVPPLSKQTEFIELLRKMETVKEHHQQMQVELDALLPSVLEKAFKGEL